MKPLQTYCVATGTWFAAHGMQHVLFAWLVTMVLRETPQMVGVAQMAMLVPVMLLMLFGGGIADALGGRRMAMLAQGFAVLPGVGLLVALLLDALTFPVMLCYAVTFGCATAFVTPARDGLLNQVAEGRIQRTVVLVSLTQFGVQMVASLIAGLTGRVGPEVVIVFQIAVLTAGVVAYSRLPSQPRAAVQAPSIADLIGSVVEGSRTVLRSHAMRPVVLQNIAMGLFFMGSYMVTMPLLIREVYDGSSFDLALVVAANMLGLVTSILWLLVGGDIRRPGRALLMAHGLGGVFLAAAGLVSLIVDVGFWPVVVCIYLWGACGGIAMSMSRTIMQQAAPDGQRGRVMAFFSFSFMGAGPVGAFLCGYLVGSLGAPLALVATSMALMAVIAVIARTSPLWNMIVGKQMGPSSRRHPRMSAAG